MVRHTIDLKGVPCGLGAGRWGASLGPEDLLNRGLEDLFKEMGCPVQTTLLDDLHPLKEPFQSGFHHKAAVLSWCQRLQTLVEKSLLKSNLPMVIGGDHSISMGSISGVSRYCRSVSKPLTVIWLDAHGDFNTSITSESGHIHGMPLASLCGYGDVDFVSMIGAEGLLDPSQVHLLGVRDLDAQEEHLLHSSKIRTYSMETLWSFGFAKVAEEILAQATSQGAPHIHLSFDLDFLDASLAQGTGTPVEKGPNFSQARELFHVLGKSGLLGSMDVVEYNPLIKGAPLTAKVLFDLLRVLFDGYSG